MNKIVAQFPTLLSLVQRFNAMNARERVLLSVSAYLIAWLLIFYCLLLPAYDYQSAKVRSMQAATSGLDWMKANTQAAKSQSESAQPVRNDNKLSVISTTARLNDVRVQRIQPVDNNVTVEVNRHPYDAVIRWLINLETAHGFRIIDARIDKADDGIVDARITLQ